MFTFTFGADEQVTGVVLVWLGRHALRHVTSRHPSTSSSTKTGGFLIPCAFGNPSACCLWLAVKFRPDTSTLPLHPTASIVPARRGRSLEAVHLKCHKGSRGCDIFQVEPFPPPRPPSCYQCFSTFTICLLVASVVFPLSRCKVPGLRKPLVQTIAWNSEWPWSNVNRGNPKVLYLPLVTLEVSLFSYLRGMSKKLSPIATSSFTFVSRHPFDEVVVPVTVVPGALDVTVPASPPDTNISPFDGNDSPSRTSGAGAHKLDDIPADEEPMASPMAVVTPELSNSPTPEFYPNAGGTIGESVSVDDPMECTTDVGSPPEVMCTHSCFSFLKEIIIHVI